MTTDEVMGAYQAGDGDELVLTANESESELLGNIAAAVTEYGDGKLWAEWSGTDPAKHDTGLVERLLPVGCMIGTYDAEFDGCVEDFDGGCLHVGILVGEPEREHLRQLREILDGLDAAGLGVECVS